MKDSFKPDFLSIADYRGRWVAAASDQSHNLSHWRRSTSFFRWGAPLEKSRLFRALSGREA